ncbi:hypothetical protein BCEN4_40017 [Burkholderia cenocepacia]|nr:hypothetical protein BCEN4_40017 [Burkholderia cenocepacia]
MHFRKLIPQISIIGKQEGPWVAWRAPGDAIFKSVDIDDVDRSVDFLHRLRPAFDMVSLGDVWSH